MYVFKFVVLGSSTFILTSGKWNSVNDCQFLHYHFICHCKLRRWKFHLWKFYNRRLRNSNVLSLRSVLLTHECGPSWAVSRHFCVYTGWSDQVWTNLFITQQICKRRWKYFTGNAIRNVRNTVNPTAMYNIGQASNLHFFNTVIWWISILVSNRMPIVKYAISIKCQRTANKKKLLVICDKIPLLSSRTWAIRVNNCITRV